MALNGKRILSLKEFMLRRKVLKLYKDIHKCIREVPNVEDQKELVIWVRKDFKENKSLKDELAIKSLLTYGERCLKELRQSLDLSR